MVMLCWNIRVIDKKQINLLLWY